MVFVRGTDWQLGAILFALAYLGYSCATVVAYSMLVDLSTSAERDHASSVGWAISYIGGGVLLALSFVPSLVVGEATLARVALCASGAWWILFTLPIRRLVPRHLGRGSDAAGSGRLLAQGFRQLAATLRHLRGYPIRDVLARPARLRAGVPEHRQLPQRPRLGW